MKKYKAAIFDLDGTLLDTLDDLAGAVNHALGEEGMPLRTREEVCTFVGNGIEKLMRRAIPQGTGEEAFQRAFSGFKTYYALHNNDRTAPYPGIPQLLLRLKAAGIRCAIVSNKNDANVKALARLYFPDTVEEAVGGMEGVRLKPAPDTVNRVLESFHLKPEEALYIGDSDVDVYTARNALCDCAAVTWGFRSRESLVAAGAVNLLDTPEELGRFLLGSSSGFQEV